MNFYLVDSNFFIQAHRAYYPMDVVPSFWIKVSDLAKSMRSHYKQRAIEEFLAAELADPWLVAYSMANNCTIVTYEKSEPSRKSRIKIPEVCNRFNVKYINTIEMLRELNESI